MPTILQVITSILSPLLLVASAGLIFMPRDHEIGLVGKSARVLLGGLTVLLLLSYLASLLSLAVEIVVLPLALLVVWVFSRRWREFKRHQTHWQAIIAVGIFLLFFTTLAVPFLTIQSGLPAGDSQKAIIWAEKINQEKSLPYYQESIAWLNRDPTDFFTPGLHALTALIIKLSPLPLTTVGYLAIFLGLGLALLATALFQTLWPRFPNLLSFGLVLILVLSQKRFLRYVQEPGYHLQNLLGEVFLVALLWLGLSLMSKWRPGDAVLFALATVSLVLSHQFSTFLFAFAFLPLLYVILARVLTGQTVAPMWLRWTGAAAATVLGLSVFFIFQVAEKIPALFTSSPHLLPLTPNFLDYPQLMGSIWLTFALSGLILLLWRWRSLNGQQRVFLGSTLILLALSQGPRWGIDIPPIRTLFYGVVPLSLIAAYFILQLGNGIKLLPTHWRRLSFTALALLVLLQSYTNLAQAYQPSFSATTNSTLQSEHIALANFLANAPQEGAVVADDYNQRSSSWLVLGGKPMYTRLASALSRQMQEAKQSDLRYRLYLNQLAYEKMYALGSLGPTATYATQHGVSWLTGITNRSAVALAANPALATAKSAGEVTLYQIASSYKTNTCQPLGENKIDWLYRTTTLANDIGDAEDTFQALPASLAANRLSAPQFFSNCTARQTTATYIPLKFNLADYVLPLWDQDKNNLIDRDLSLLVQWQEIPSSEIMVETSTGQRYLLTPNEPLLIPSSEMLLSTDGFLTVWLHNPTAEVLSIDLIALGLNQTL